MSFATKKRRLKNTQNGMTLIEVLIAMFVLAVGILALLAVQLRAVSGVREAETQTIVSQVTQSFIEGMLVNPILRREINASTRSETGRMLKSYGHYINARDNTTAEYSETMSKQELAAAQIASFRRDLSAALPEIPAQNIHFSICRDNSGLKPQYSANTVNYRCDDTGDTVIKVLWLVDAEESNAAETGQNNNTGLIRSGNFIVYTHQSRVTE